MQTKLNQIGFDLTANDLVAKGVMLKA